MFDNIVHEKMLNVIGTNMQVTEPTKGNFGFFILKRTLRLLLQGLQSIAVRQMVKNGENGKVGLTSNRQA
jgi:hypothetical protein